MKINLFLVGTTYQFLSAINLCITKFQNNEFVNHVYYWESPSLKVTNPEALTNFNGFIIPVLYQDRIRFAKELASYKCHRFFFFQENDILNKYIAHNLKKGDTIICLGPDGTKPYAVYDKKHELLSMVKDTINDYLFLIKNRLIINSIVPSRFYRYGSSKIIDEVYVQYTNLFDFRKNGVKAKIEQLPDLENHNVIKISESLLFDKSEIDRINGNILYFNQPLWSDSLVKKELELIMKIKNHYNDKTIFIKLHPSTTSKTVELYSYLKDIVIIQDQGPAEFFLAHLSNTICFSGWSASLMHNLGNGNSYYYLYPIYSEVGDRILSQINPIGFPHIKVLNTSLLAQVLA